MILLLLVKLSLDTELLLLLLLAIFASPNLVKFLLSTSPNAADAPDYDNAKYSNTQHLDDV